MADPDLMPKANLENSGKKLSSYQKVCMQRVLDKNKERVAQLAKSRRKSRFVGISLALGVVSIYSYTLWAIKQEHFLDDFNEPEKVSN